MASVLGATHGAFLYWGIALPWRQPLMPHHVAYLVTYAAAIAPLLVVNAVAAAGALRDGQSAQRAAWLRVAWFVPCYFVVSLPAFLRVGGGAFEFGPLTFLLAILGLAYVTELLAAADGPLSRLTATTLAALQLLLWAPTRHAPSDDDRKVAETVCAHVREAVGCGERVLIDMGTACLVSQPVREPARDRLPTMMELTWAGLGNTPAAATRLAREDYDMLALHFMPLPWPWSARARDLIAQHYQAFTALPPNSELPNTRFGLNDKPRFDDWQGMDWGVVLFERKRESGRHRKTIAGPARCAGMTARAREPR
jgi:hypothetical protein